MTTATDHTPSRSCHIQGCDRPECALASYRYMSALRLDHSRGIRRLRGAAPVLDHIQRLMANEWLVRQIADASGVSESAIRYVLYGQPTISRDRARAILNIPIGPPPADLTVTAATGTIRRLRALACLGHTLDSIGGEINISRWRLGRIITGTYTEIDTATADKVTQVYRRLSTFRSNNPHTIRRARAEAWHGPLAWDDIDNPDCQPEPDAPYEAVTKYERDPDKNAEIEHLYLLGESPEQIAKQLGNNEKYINDQLGAILRRRAEAAQKAREEVMRTRLGAAA
ncbi:hypothetical protein ACWD25_29155 [Streptomyces sp. NPDC002920]